MSARAVKRVIPAGLLACLLALPAMGADTDPAECLDCHDYGDDSPVHRVLAGAHGLDAESTGGRGCLACHGDSAAHRAAPRRNAPDVSFGPRWSASAGDQDAACLGCHEDNTARNWEHALHMYNNLTCVTCHDMHSEEDRVQVAATQDQVCETCHKVQKSGIHGMERRKNRNPSCATCHNPHYHEDAQATLLATGSDGCRTCHDLARMAESRRVSDKAKRYHAAMDNTERTCVDCHEGIAHAPADSAPPMHPLPAASARVTLYYPGMTDTSWLLHDHPGAQPLRQGANCRQCHRGDEAGMGEILADGSVNPTSREVEVAVARAGEALTVTISWDGPADDAQLSLMWGDRSVDAFARGGCFAACHSDMPGMRADRGQVSQKYLAISRAQQQQVGRPAIVADRDTLDALAAAGKLAEIWRLDLAGGKFRIAPLLDGTPWQERDLIHVNKRYDQGRWTVAMTRQLHDTGTGFLVLPGRRYTFGIALHGIGQSGAKHWVSLPLTLSFGGDDTDFTAE
jgi:predicted CXXCH cytochrome family protein